MTQLKAIKILMIHESLGKERGGIQVHVSTLTQSLQGIGHEVIHFIVPPLFLTKQGGSHRAASTMKNTASIFYHFMKFLFILQNDDIDFDVVHVHGPRIPLILGYLISRITRRPLVVTMHEVNSQSTKYNKLWKKADKIITISKELMNVLICYGAEKSKLVYIPNMVEIEHPENLPASDEKIILYIGRLHPSKIGILKILLKATPTIIQKVPETQVWIVGPDGSSANEIRQISSKINDNHTTNIVTLLGYVSNPEYYIAKSSVVVGVGRVALESIIQGKPTILGSSTNDQFFTGDLVTEENIEKLETYNFTGRNYNNRIDSDKMAEIIIDLLNNNSYISMVEKNRSYVMANFEKDVVTKKIVDMYIESTKNQYKK